MNMKPSVLIVSIWSVLVVMPVQAVVSIGPQVIVTGTTIEILEPGPDIQSIIDDIDDAVADKPYLIKLGPGEYTITPDISTSKGLVMAPYISIMGSGQGVTILKGAVSGGSADSTSAVMTGASNANLTDLTVWNTGTASLAIAVLFDGTSLHMENVTAIVSGGASINGGVANQNGSSPTMSNVIVKASGAITRNVAVANDNGSNPRMSNVVATATGTASENVGIGSSNSSPIMNNVTATAEGGTTVTTAISIGPGSEPIMHNLTATASGGTANVGVSIVGPGGGKFYSSTIKGTTAIEFSGSTTARLIDTLLDGIVSGDDGGTTNCRNTYDAALSDVSC